MESANEPITVDSPVAPYVPSRADITLLQAEAAKLPQIELPTQHYFADGMYCRVVFIPAGTLFVGRIHSKEHFFVICSGTLRVTTENGIQELTGPVVMTSPPGTKRVGLTLTDMTCLTVHRVASRDFEEIEREIVEHEDGLLFDFQNRLKVPAIKEKI